MNEVAKAVQVIASQYCLDNFITCSLDDVVLNDYPEVMQNEIEAILKLFEMYR